MKKLALLILIGLLFLSVDGPASAQSSPAFTTGGGWIVLSSGGEGTFGVFARTQKDGTPIGHVVYINHDTGLSVMSTMILSFTPGCTSSTILGVGNSNAGPVVFDVTVTDQGEPGTLDIFTISVTGAAADSQSGSLAGGNIQVHGSCP